MSVFHETFTGADNTEINGFNSWVANSANFQIQSNRASMTSNGGVWAYRDLTALGVLGKVHKCSFGKYNGNGLRFIQYWVLGSSDISSVGNFKNNGITLYFYRSGTTPENTTGVLYDGTTSVVSKALSFQFDGTELIVEMDIASDGSGTVTFTQGASSDTLTWSARTWTKGGGQYFGFELNHNGSDGLGQTTRSYADDFIVDLNGGATGILAGKKIMVVQ